jgi:hypothetical protein
MQHLAYMSFTLPRGAVFLSRLALVGLGFSGWVSSEFRLNTISGYPEAFMPGASRFSPGLRRFA